jgi:hypothetical protein
MKRRWRRAAKDTPPVIFRWDLDKTYLRSSFDTLRGLARIPFEHPEDKVNVPGVVPLIRGLRSEAARAGREAHTYFITASPPQIGKAIRGKFALDGIEYDGIVFKDQLRHIVRGKFSSLREHVGFKLAELLRSRIDTAAEAKEILFGDDWESDPVIYSLYADLLAARLDTSELGKVLGLIGVDPRSIAKVQQLAERVVRADAVERIYINLERRTPPARFRWFGPRLVPAYNYLQTACCLYEDGYLTLDAVTAVARDLMDNVGYTPQRLANSIADVSRRGHLGIAGVTAIRDHFERETLFPSGKRHPGLAAVWKRVQAWWQRKEVSRQASPEPIDYAALATEWRASR